MVGISLKLALFPLHLWLPNAYAYAPSTVSAFLAATATKVAIYVLLRFVFTIFGATFAFEIMPLGEILLVLALLAPRPFGLRVHPKDLACLLQPVPYDLAPEIEAA